MLQPAILYVDGNGRQNGGALAHPLPVIYHRNITDKRQSGPSLRALSGLSHRTYSVPKGCNTVSRITPRQDYADQ